MKICLNICYQGSDFHGWQTQPTVVTVQETLEQTLFKLFKKRISVYGCGRTDAGVHAKEMFAHFDFESIEDTSDLAHRLNNYLPADIAVKAILKVKPESHARFDALERTYEYWLVQQKNPCDLDTGHYVNRLMDIQKMNEAAKVIMEHTDFECFSKSQTDVKTYLCDIKKAKWKEMDDRLVFTISADRFLRNMVRAIVGTLLEVGLGKWTVDDVKTILESNDRSKAGTSVPAKGLYLVNIKYPQKIINP